MAEAADIADRVTAAFTKIHRERMHGVPILNPHLEVEVIGARFWEGRWLSVLVTPWFINLMLLPATDTEAEAEAWGKLNPGASIGHRLPAGRFDFLVGEEESLGRYQMCSLFSPVLEFEDQEAARIAAEAALAAIFDASLDEEAPDARTAKEELTRQTGAEVEAHAEPLSRRGLLLGKVRSGGDHAS